MIKTLELFSGTESFSKYARKRNYKTFTVDSNREFNPNLVCDLSKVLPDRLWWEIEEADIIWMSPPCQTFSMASGNKHWTADRLPKTSEAIEGKRLLDLCKMISVHCEQTGKIYFIENPRARARWFLPEDTRKTIWYCQYGDTRAKPTDIWTNLKGWTPKTCKNGNKDCHHEPAPRGSKTGTQGVKGARDREIIPEAVFVEIFDMIGSTIRW